MRFEPEEVACDARVGLHSRSAGQTVCSLKNYSGSFTGPAHSWPVTSAIQDISVPACAMGR